MAKGVGAIEVMGVHETAPRPRQSDGTRTIGLGDAIVKATSTARIQPCAGCKRRADALNRRLTLRVRNTKPRGPSQTTRSMPRLAGVMALGAASLVVRQLLKSPSSYLSS